MTINLPACWHQSLTSLAALILVTVCMTTEGSPMVVDRNGESSSLEAQVKPSIEQGAVRRPRQEPAAVAVDTPIEERTETLLTYFGIEPRLVLSPGSSLGDRAGADDGSDVKQEHAGSVVPEPKEVLVLMVGCALLAAGIAMRGWLARTR